MNAVSQRDWEIRALANDSEASHCASAMAASDPWLTLGIPAEALFRHLTDRTREVFVVGQEGRVAGSLILNLNGPLKGYIQSIFVFREFQNQGLGARIVEFAEQRIFRECPNAFLCVSSFNEKAQRWYHRLGYEKVGELTDYLVAGHSEIILRKTRGPALTYSPSRA